LQEGSRMASEDTQDVRALVETLDQMLGGFQTTQALHVAARLAILDVLHSGPKTSSALADAVGAHEPSLRRLLGFLTTIDILTHDGDGRFAATAMGDLLRADHPESARPWALLLGAPPIWRPWGELYEAIVSGRPAFDQVYGEPYFTYLGHRDQEAALFNAAMTSDSNLSAILDAYDFSGFAKIVDVGGGQGALLRGILEQSPQATGVLYDLPSLVAQGHELKNSAVAERCEVVGGDMFDSVPAGGDAYILKRIIHDWSDAEALEILRNCRQAMSDQGTLLLIESIRQPAHHADPATAADLMMLVLVTGRERTEEEFRELYAAAGFTLTRVLPAGGRSIIEGVCV
jgi:hypothetical protein